MCGERKSGKGFRGSFETFRDNGGCMKVIETSFPGLLVIEPTVFRDRRGFFLESYNRDRFAEAGVDAEFVQDNHALSVQQGVLRGFHLQQPPAAQAKLVWVVRGRVLDVAVDVRKGSPTYGKAFATELDADRFTRLFIPRGFAHAYLTLESNTEFLYKVDAPYDPAMEAGFRWDDPDIGVDWVSLLNGPPILSDKDASLPFFRDFDSPFRYGEDDA